VLKFGTNFCKINFPKICLQILASDTSADTLLAASVASREVRSKIPGRFYIGPTYRRGLTGLRQARADNPHYRKFVIRRKAL
jgi:hypothetical protein